MLRTPKGRQRNPRHSGAGRNPTSRACPARRHFVPRHDTIFDGRACSARRHRRRSRFRRRNLCQSMTQISRMGHRRPPLPPKLCHPLVGWPTASAMGESIPPSQIVPCHEQTLWVNSHGVRPKPTNSLGIDSRMCHGQIQLTGAAPLRDTSGVRLTLCSLFRAVHFTAPRTGTLNVPAALGHWHDARFRVADLKASFLLVMIEITFGK